MAAPPPPPPPRTPPELTPDLLGEILVWAALVCKPWCRAVSDPAFRRRYRAFHRTPPLLGFLHNLSPDDGGVVARFVSTTTAASPCSPPAFDCRSWWALDCRHGRVLVLALDPVGALIVWDPITGGQQCLPLPAHYDYSTGAVAGCDHLDCRGGPFLVVFVGTDDEDVTRASVYSSETGVWSASTSADLDSFVEMKPSLLAGDAVYFALSDGHTILEYNLGGRALSVIDAEEVGSVMTAEDGGLGYVVLEGHSVCTYGPGRLTTKESVIGCKAGPSSSIRCSPVLTCPVQ